MIWLIEALGIPLTIMMILAVIVRRPSKQPRWEVEMRSGANSDNRFTVEVLVTRKGSRACLVGCADPIHDLEEFLNLQVQATERADTLNTLKVE